LTPDHLRELVVGLNHSLRPASEKESTLTTDDAIQRYKLLYATLAPNQEAGGPPTVIGGTLTPAFTKFLGTTKLVTAQRELSEMLAKAFSEARASDHRLDANADFDHNIVDKVLTACLKDCTWLSDSLNIAYDKIKYAINLAVFAVPSRKSQTFLNRMHSDNTTASQEAVGEEATKMAKKNNELYIDGKLSTAEDIKTLLCNLRIIGLAMCSTFEESEMWKALAAGENVLRTINGGHWISLAGNDNPQVALNLLVDFQDVLNQYVQIANTSEYRTALADKEPISPVAYQRANALGEEITKTLFAAVQRSHLGQYQTNIPVVSRAFTHMRLPARGGRGAPPNGAPPNDTMPRGPAPNPAVPRNPGRANAQMPAGEQERGFLKWSGSGPPPICHVTVKLSTMDSAERICTKFCVQGSVCNYGTRCKFAHPTAFHQIPNTPAKEAFVTFVKRAPNLAFMQGQGPPGTN
jgi:hypothetical protein